MLPASRNSLLRNSFSLRRSTYQSTLWLLWLSLFLCHLDHPSSDWLQALSSWLVELQQWRIFYDAIYIPSYFGTGKTILDSSQAWSEFLSKRLHVLWEIRKVVEKVTVHQGAMSSRDNVVLANIGYRNNWSEISWRIICQSHESNAECFTERV